jgi:hypothetical protein
MTHVEHVARTGEGINEYVQGFGGETWRDRLEDLDADGCILKFICKKYDGGGRQIGFILLRISISGDPDGDEH